ncbi:TonB-linked outer membrane protein, SusC/RagA family [Algoriphagus faecimaris]|uniref:TonB-linked outer membrane protein, SusC/RagA family n=1 Tax=Algoriphagus faecimaris TaxID=686796 RepID=A0A1G6UBM4_9BACT|nr:SusC/RagA family TonB-linked outer membrane protein [Algoriphagus faecimaris]SDD37997.1 TonB-linked outer membrane protein, SusC/RagA family [Algoriphagus faecimaris]
MKKQILLLLALLLIWEIKAQDLKVSGTVLEPDQSTPIPGVNVVLKGTSLGTVTNEEGDFVLILPDTDSPTLVISFIGYKTQELVLSPDQTSSLRIILEMDELGLDEVAVVSTGFEELPAERATGSFAKLDQELVDRRISTNIIDRLEDLTPGLIFNRDRSDLEYGEDISIRGTGTIRSDSQPLIVIDNLPYEGPLSNINPNDVESITVLRDAAAASIWGARAGNGVIVITTKSGTFDQPVRISLTANTTIGQAPDPFYRPQMSINDFVNKEIQLYEDGAFAGAVNSFFKSPVSPLVETLYAFEQGQLTPNERDARIARFRNSDVRNELSKYMYRPSLLQQYALNLNGGGGKHSYLFSLGWDDNRQNQVAQNNSRLTLNTVQNFKLAKDRLNLSLGAYLAISDSEDGLPAISNFYPYDRLADENGNPLPVYRSFHQRFKESTVGTGLLDWEYYPLDEIGLSPRINRANDLRLTANLDYRISRGLNFKVNYQYWTNQQNNEQNSPQTAYTTRELINDFTEIDPNGNLINHVPLGGILDFSNQRSFSHTLRGQLTYEKRWNDHQLNVLAGSEIRDVQSEGNSGRAYGFNSLNATSQPVDYLSFFTLYSIGFPGTIPFVQNFSGTVNRYVSGFGNAGYSYKDRYFLTASARVDASNIFGVNTNQRAVPLWSAGLGWILTEESFVNSDWLDFLKMRLSYGYNGNTNPNATAFTTANYFGAGSNPLINSPFLGILSPPNPELRWERIQITNLGLDYEMFNGRLSGYLEYYRKRGLDLLGEQPLFASSGVGLATINYASTKTAGLDWVLNTKILNGPVKWTNNFFLSWVKEEVTDFENDPTVAQVLTSNAGSPVPVIGRPLYYTYSLPWGGLDPDSGDPRGIINGEPSTDYSTILNESELEELIYHGSSRPTLFGSFRNTLEWKGFLLSANISYRMGYYFRRQTINYDNLNRGEFEHADYERRWRQPGDELTTDIPSDPGTVNASRNQFLLRSESLVEKGDHIRLQDIRIAYRFGRNRLKGIQNLEIYAYGNNLGLIWKASKEVPDPDFRTSPSLRTLSFGLKANF